MFEPGCALLVLDGGALLLMNSSLHSPRHIHTALLGDAVTLVLKDLLTLLLDIVDGLTLPLVLGPALPLELGVLDWPLGDLTLPLVGVSTHGGGNILALPPLNGVVGGPGHLLTGLLRHLATGGLRGGLTNKGRRVELLREVHSQG